MHDSVNVYVYMQAVDDPSAQVDLRKEMQYACTGELYDRLCIAQLLATLASGMAPYQVSEQLRETVWIDELELNRS